MILLALAAQAADLRDYCPERPGLNQAPCIIDRGHVSIETSLADWTRDEDADARTDTVLIGDTLLRIGLTDTVEAQIGWTPYGHVRTRDKQAGGVDRVGGVGDVQLGLSVDFAHPDGKDFAIAAQPFVTLPVGRSGIGAGDWGAGVLLPINYDLSDALSLEATPELDAAVNESGDGRHLRFGSAVGVQVQLTEKLSVEPEVQLLRDDDPAGHATTALASLSLAFKAGENLQLDVQGVAGLNSDSPDVEILGGFAVRL